MKKLLLLLITALPFLANAQVQAPGTVEGTPILLERTGWTATANSGAGPDGPYARLFDGDNDTYWNSNYNSAETNIYPHIITVDMQSVQSYAGIMIRPRNGSRKPNSMTFRRSNTGEDGSWTDIVTVTGENAVKTQYFEFATQTSRYLQVEITTGYGDENGELAEIATWLTKTVTDNTAYSRIGWTVTGNNTQGIGGTGDNGGYAATLDGDATTYWHTRWGTTSTSEGIIAPFANGGAPITLEYNMLQALKINKISLIHRTGNTAGHLTNFKVSYKKNPGDAWTTLTPIYSATLTGPNVNSIPLGETIEAQYIKIDIYATSGASNAMLAEFRTHFDQTLPVTLTSFTAKAKGSSVNLNWATASEKDASHFNITRSKDGSNFTTIGKVDAAGNTSTVKNYSFTDNTPFAGINYYQLQQVDYNGDINTSGITSAKVALSSAELIVKEITADQIIIALKGVNATSGTITAVNAQGQKLASQAVDFSNGNAITVKTAAKGLIILTLTTAEGSISKKIVK